MSIQSRYENHESFTFEDVEAAFRSGWIRGAANFGGPNSDEEEAEIIDCDFGDYINGARE